MTVGVKAGDGVKQAGGCRRAELVPSINVGQVDEVMDNVSNVRVNSSRGKRSAFGRGVC